MAEKKFTNEELTAMVSELNIQNQRLQKQVTAMQTTNLFNVMTFAFKVLENADKFDEAFVKQSTEFIANSMTQIIDGEA